jgi:type 1 glutamine amidotransferase
VALLFVVVCAPAYGGQARVLVLSEAKGFVHDSIPTAVATFERFGRLSSRYDVVHLRGGAAQLTPARLRGARAVVFANTTGELPLTPAAKIALVAFVRGGGGLVGTHSAADTFHDWPRFTNMLGGEFKTHPPPFTATLAVTPHAITRGLPRSLPLHEEYYEFTTDAARRAHVLMRIDAARPLVWCRHEGRGRVFYSALGHFNETWTNPRIRTMTARGLAWALGLGNERCAPDRPASG